MTDISLSQLHINGSITRGSDLTRHILNKIRLLQKPLSTSFGPLGLDKIIINTLGDIQATNDGATILNNLHVENPLLKVITRLANHQDVQVGDGTTSVVLLACELITAGTSLKSTLPTSIILNGFKIAYRECLNFLKSRQKDTLRLDSTAVNNIIKTCIRSKVIHTEASHFIDLLSNVFFKKLAVEPKVYKAYGMGMGDSSLYEAYLINCRPDKNAFPLTGKKNLRFVCLDFDLQTTKLPLNVQVSLKDAKDAESIIKAEESINKDRINALIKANVQLVLTTKGIDDYSARLLNKSSIAAVKRVKKEDLLEIATLFNVPVVRTLSDLQGNNFLAENCIATTEISVLDFPENQVMVQLSSKKAASLVLRGGNEQLLDEMERSVHDALCILKRLKENKSILPSGGAAEISLFLYLHDFVKSVETKEYLAIEKYAESLLILPRLIAENAGLDSDRVLQELLKVQSTFNQETINEWADFGMDLNSEFLVGNNIERGIIEPAVVKMKALRTATEAAISVLRIDEIIALNPEIKEKRDDDHCQ